MNAPALIRQPSRRSFLVRMDDTEQERSYRAAISVHCPNENEVSMACRVDLAIMRDQASAGLARASESAFAILSEVARITAIEVYAPRTTKHLLHLRGALTLTMEAARQMHRAQNNG